jgi:outer membrane protein assembly factor BamD (BamD/ComL family)
MQSDGVSIYHVIRGAVVLIVAGGLLGWLFFRALKRSEDPAKLAFKWVVTAVVVGATIYLVSGPISLLFVPVALITSAVLLLLWGSSIGSLFAKPFTMVYEDNAEIEPRPYYSIAEAKRKKGLYTEAVAEIRKQLNKFPTDFQGQMMLAEIQAENLNDLQGAEITIHRLCEQSGHPPHGVAFALNTLADWQLKYTLDRDAAQQTLEKIVERYPNTELGILASQRIAHLASKERLLELHDRHRIQVPEGIKNIGLLQSSAQFVPRETEPAKAAAEYVKHLEQHPLDSEAREKLAIIYADHYKRLDLAADQLDQLIELPNQPAKSVVRWLNLLADLQVRHGSDYDVVRQTLERIVDRYPNHAAAGLARNRMDLLKLELKTKEKSKDVKLGTYEQYIGLKHGPPKHY